MRVGGPAPDKGPGWRGGPTRGERLAPVRLFISPSGEPFRGEDGLGHWIAQADTDHDGSVSLAEFRADALHSFKVLDTNGDGVISGLELQHYEHDLVPEVSSETFDTGPTAGRASSSGRTRRRRAAAAVVVAAADAAAAAAWVAAAGTARPARLASSPDTSTDQRHAIPGAGLMGAARYSLINEPEPISAADTNLDGKVTLAEWMAITDRRFAKLDHLKTGKLTRQSLLHPPPKPKGAPSPRRRLGD